MLEPERMEAAMSLPGDLNAGRQPSPAALGLPCLLSSQRGKRRCPGQAGRGWRSSSLARWRLSSAPLRSRS